MGKRKTYAQSAACLEAVFQPGGDEGCRDVGPVEIAGQPVDPERIVAILRPLIGEERFWRIEAVLAERTRTVVPVFDGITNTGNVSAAVRTAEALGYQEFHAVRCQARYRSARRATRGAERWTDLISWSRPATCIGALRARGIEPVAMHPAANGTPIETLDFSRPTALVFGNEKSGISDEMLELVPRRCALPICGFSRSFNVSVAAAIALYHARQDRLRRSGFHGDLTPEQRVHLKARYFLRSVREAEKIVQRALEQA